MHELKYKGDPILKTVCKEVAEFDDSLYELVKDMRQIMQTNKGCGLAAPQAGETLRVIVVQKQKGKGTYAVCNPVIVRKSEYTNKLEEGCLSYPGIKKMIERPNFVVVNGNDLQGREITITAAGFEARIFCHECDHLDGIDLLAN
jgi:peptide deformylase